MREVGPLRDGGSDDRPADTWKPGKAVGEQKAGSALGYVSQNSCKCVVLRWVGESCFQQSQNFIRTLGMERGMIFVTWSFPYAWNLFCQFHRGKTSFFPGVDILVGGDK